MRTTISITAALLLAVLFPQVTTAQVSGSASSGINTSSGLFGSRSLGQSVGGPGSNFGGSGGIGGSGSGGLGGAGSGIQQAQSARAK